MLLHMRSPQPTATATWSVSDPAKADNAGPLLGEVVLELAEDGPAVGFGVVRIIVAKERTVSLDRTKRTIRVIN